MTVNIVIIPPELQAIKERIFDDTRTIAEDKSKLIDDVGIVAAVKVPSWWPPF
jgi:hypothetical protein